MTASAIRPELATADGAEVTDYLRTTGGWTAIRTDLTQAGLLVEVADPAATEAALDAALDAFVPTAARGEYIDPLPPAVAAAVSDLRAFYSANPASLTGAQSATLLRAVTVLLRYLNRRLE